MDVALAHAHQMGTRVLGSERKGQVRGSPEVAGEQGGGQGPPGIPEPACGPLGALGPYSL